MKALLLSVVCLLTACAQHTIDENSAVQQSVDQQNRHFETMGVPTRPSYEALPPVR